MIARVSQAGGERQDLLLEAWNGSYLAQLPTDLRDVLLADAKVIVIERGNRVDWGGRFVVIQSGLARIMALAADGRSVTLRYAAAGQVVGLPSAISSDANICAEAITECRVLSFNVRKVNDLSRSRAEMANLLQREVTVILYEVIDLLAQNVFSSVRSRVCRHLLNMAIESDGKLVVAVDQNSIAESIGSVREVVAREIRKLRETGVLYRHGRLLAIAYPERLIALGKDGP